MLREFHTIPYVPTLPVRPAEMIALKELPEKDKDLLMPLILMRGWVGSNELQNSLDKIAEVYDNRPWLVDIDPDFHSTENVRPVHLTIEELKASDNGYQNWCEFVASQKAAIPCLQLMDLDQLAPQIARLAKLDRGVAVRLMPEMYGGIDAIILALSSVQGLRPLIIFDYGQANRQIIDRAATTIPMVQKIHAALPDACIVVCATTFPSSFVNVNSQDIFERQFFNMVKDNCNGIPLIYGDRGSARAEKQMGGGGTPSPRIDYPLSDQWRFFRKETPKPQGYFDAAEELIERSGIWDPKLRIWGTQWIERTANKDQYAITSPAKSTAVRINIHMHIQLHYGAPPEEVLDTDDEWVD